MGGERGTYAMAAMRGPLDVKSPPVERTLPPWMRVGWVWGEYEPASSRCFATYSSEAAAVTRSDKSARNVHEGDDVAHRLSKCTVCDSPTTVPTRAARATIAVEKENCMVCASEGGNPGEDV